MRVALVVMPWFDAAICPLGVAALKASLAELGIAADAHYLNLRLADRIGPGLYERLSANPRLWPEWFFAYHLFGPGGSRELAEKFEDAARRPGFAEFAADAGVPRARLKSLLLRDVPAFLDECLDGIDWGRYDLVGFSSSMYTHAACLTLAKRIKDRFGVKIAVGGPNVEGEMGRATLDGCEWVDFVVDGEGEEALRSIVRGLGTNAGRAVVRAAKRVDPSSLPLPDHGDYFAQRRALPGLAGVPATLTFETSRGCWWGQKSHCTFCGIPDEALVYKEKTPERAAAEIWELHARYGADRMYAADLIMSRDHAARLMPELARLRRRDGSDLRIFYETKSNLTREQLESFAAAGVVEILAGIESLSTPALKRMRKGVTAIQNVQTLKWGLASGISVIWNHLYGFPGEDMGEYARVADGVLSLTHLRPPSGFGPVRPDRFSPYRENPAAFGLKPPRPDPVYASLYPAKRFDLDKIAYSFRFAPGSAAGEKDARVRKLRRRVEFWKDCWPRAFFASVRGVDRVELYDARPTREGGSFECRRAAVTGTGARALRACESVRTFGEILAACREKEPGLSPAELRGLLDSMTARRWLWREDDRYLNLSVPASKLPTEQRWLFDRLLAAPLERTRPSFGSRRPLA